MASSRAPSTGVDLSGDKCPNNLYPKHYYFSDPSCQFRQEQKPERLAEVLTKPNAFKAFQPESKLITDSSWDKYFFFSVPHDGSFVSKTATKGKMRIPALGTNTFERTFVQKIEDKMREERPNFEGKPTEQQEKYQDRMGSMYKISSIGKDREYTDVPHIFPNGHVTCDKLMRQIRPHAKCVGYMPV